MGRIVNSAITDQRERDKYRRIWAVPQYRRSSPGERAADGFLKAFKWQKGQTLIDLGCGTGRASRIFSKAGLDVTMLDFCPTAPEVDLPFVEANLWELPDSLPKFDWIFSVDVLEHLPEDFVGPALDNMARITNLGGYLQVATFEEAFGSMIGEVLHLTVKHFPWWKEQVKMRWDIKASKAQGNSYAQFLLGASKVV